MKHICLAMTGASGAIYGWRLLECLLSSQCQISLLISSAAEVVLKQELDVELPNPLDEKARWIADAFPGADPARLTLYDREDWFSPVASGSAPLHAMVICPASGGNLSAIAHGASNNLIERAADVCLKEKRRLLLVPRETPVSQIHLENMLKLSQMGAVILPASPGFYHRPQQITALVDFIVARILDQLDIAQELIPPWGNPNH